MTRLSNALARAGLLDTKGDLGIFGYDWLDSTAYDERIKMVTENTKNFLYFGDSLHKGTLRTAKNC